MTTIFRSTIYLLILFSTTQPVCAQSPVIRADSILLLLTKSNWTTCGLIDSIKESNRIQFINKEILQGTSNCSGQGAAQSEWVFSTTSNSLLIKNIIGWNAPDQARQVSELKWRWEYNDQHKCLYLYPSEYENTMAGQVSIKPSFCLVIKELSDKTLVVVRVR